MISRGQRTTAPYLRRTTGFSAPFGRSEEPLLPPLFRQRSGMAFICGRQARLLQTLFDLQKMLRAKAYPGAFRPPIPRPRDFRPFDKERPSLGLGQR